MVTILLHVAHPLRSLRFLINTKRRSAQMERKSLSSVWICKKIPKDQIVLHIVQLQTNPKPSVVFVTTKTQRKHPYAVKDCQSEAEMIVEVAKKILQRSSGVVLLDYRVTPHSSTEVSP
eukprot:TRINITY_DN22394_c0_g1_i4.p1 TRINITY_DN22394_c0_g1~~TRINITY_DN22394_c0_g1_i4.p1  ORF type:complete len:119 (+),score=15.82 TRINITY_DN22394_c0_g1_i4:583-939(+)